MKFKTWKEYELKTVQNEKHLFNKAKLKVPSLKQKSSATGE